MNYKRSQSVFFFVWKKTKVRLLQIVFFRIILLLLLHITYIKSLQHNQNVNNDHLKPLTPGHKWIKFQSAKLLKRVLIWLYQHCALQITSVMTKNCVLLGFICVISLIYMSCNKCVLKKDIKRYETGLMSKTIRKVKTSRKRTKMCTLFIDWDITL